MAKTFITSDYDSWLYDNYPNKSNKDLAVQLTSMIGKENREQLERLYRMRPLITQTTLRQTLDRQIAWRERFTKVTENMVKKAAMRLSGLRKSPLFLSSANRNKARTTNIRKWKSQAKSVENADKWLRSFRCREVRICRLDNPGDIRRIRNAVNNFNRLESLTRGIIFNTELIREANLLRVVATPRYTGNRA